MMKALFGGDGTPDPPNTATVGGDPPEGDPASHFSKENPSGNEGDTDMGTTTVATPSNTNEKRLPWSPDTELSSVQEGNDDEEKEMKDAESVAPTRHWHQLLETPNPQ
jgi:hypothetical protein